MNGACGCIGQDQTVLAAAMMLPIQQRTTTMAKNTITTRKPTDQQKTIMRLASRSRGVTRNEVLEALGMDQVSYRVPVQIMVKKVAARFGMEFVTEYIDNPAGGPEIAVYGMRPAAERAAATTARSTRKVAR
jgi:hypothetical protein